MLGLSRKDLEVTPIVAYGLLFLLVVLGALGLERFWKHENAVAAELGTAQSELATLQSLSGENPWADRFAYSQALRQATTIRLWTGGTSGVIAADLQQSMRRDAQALGFQSVQVRVDPDPVDVDGVDVLSFEFAGRAPDGKAAVSLFEAIAGHDKQIVIRDVDFSQNIRDRRPPRLALSGIIPILIVAPTDQAPQNGAQAQPRQALPYMQDPMTAPSSGQRTVPRGNNQDGKQ